MNSSFYIIFNLDAHLKIIQLFINIFILLMHWVFFSVAGLVPKPQGEMAQTRKSDGKRSCPFHASWRTTWNPRLFTTPFRHTYCTNRPFLASYAILADVQPGSRSILAPKSARTQFPHVLIAVHAGRYCAADEPSGDCSTRWKVS